jgi:hypothetical protein
MMRTAVRPRRRQIGGTWRGTVEGVSVRANLKNKETPRTLIVSYYIAFTPSSPNRIPSSRSTGWSPHRLASFSFEPCDEEPWPGDETDAAEE